MEPEHPFVIARLMGVFLCALPAVRELYQYVTDPRCVNLVCAVEKRRLTTLAPYPPIPLPPPHHHSVLCPTRRRAVRMGQHVWLLLATIGTELLAITKWSQGQFPEPLPRSVRWAWTVGATLLVLYPTVRVCGVVLPCFETRGQLTGGLRAPPARWVHCSSDNPRCGGICASTGGTGSPRLHRHEARAGLLKLMRGVSGGGGRYDRIAGV